MFCFLNHIIDIKIHFFGQILAVDVKINWVDKTSTQRATIYFVGVFFFLLKSLISNFKINLELSQIQSISIFWKNSLGITLLLSLLLLF